MVLTQLRVFKNVAIIFRFHTTMVLSFYYRNYTRLAEAKSNLLCSFVGKTFRVRIRVSLVSEILYFEPDLTL